MMSHLRGRMLYIGLYKENMMKSCLSETKKPRALLFNMLHHLVVFYRVYSNNVPGAKNGPITGVIEAYIKSPFFRILSCCISNHTMICQQYFTLKHKPLTPEEGSKGHFLFSESSHKYLKLMGMKHRTP